ncbi:hypothetical protein ACQKWADRAFT_267162 [Trichoderma austrokoningii]
MQFALLDGVTCFGVQLLQGLTAFLCIAWRCAATNCILFLIQFLLLFLLFLEHSLCRFSTSAPQQLILSCFFLVDSHQAPTLKTQPKNYCGARQTIAASNPRRKSDPTLNDPLPILEKICSRIFFTSFFFFSFFMNNANITFGFFHTCTKDEYLVRGYAFAGVRSRLPGT